MPDASSSKLLADFNALCLKETKPPATTVASNVEPAATTTITSSNEQDPELLTLRQRVRACGECLVRIGCSSEDFHRAAPSITLDRICSEYYAVHVVDDYYLLRPPIILSPPLTTTANNNNNNNSANDKAEKKMIEEIPDVRIAVVGNVDAGKSTTLGVLTKGQLDNGRGSARYTFSPHTHTHTHNIVTRSL